MKRGEALIAVAFVGLGLAWSWWGPAYDQRSPSVRVLLTLVSAAVSFLLMWGGLAMARVPRQRRGEGAAWAILPWNSVLLSQLTYVGYFFIPLEVLASSLLLRRRTPLSRGGAFLLAALVRAVVFATMVGAAAAARQWLPR